MDSIHDMWTYHWLHIPTGEIGVSTQNRFSSDCIRWRRLNDAIDYWNSSQPGVWQFWA